MNEATVSGNSTTGSRGYGAGILSIGSVTLTHSTVADNRADSDNSTGGGIWNSDGNVLITNSIVAGNSTGGGMPDIKPGLGSLNVNFSLIENTSGLVITGTDNVLGVDPLLGPLMDNGGPTQTHALLPGSPAIDRGDPAIPFNPNDFDQRGAPFLRIHGDRIDMGAVEFAAQELGWQNLANPNDVDHDGTVSPVDALLVINQLNQTEYADPLTGRLPATRPDADAPCLDVNDDLFVSPLDALQVINALNQSSLLISSRLPSLESQTPSLNSSNRFQMESTSAANNSDDDDQLSQLDRFFATLSGPAEPS